MLISKNVGRTPFRRYKIFILNMAYPRGCLKYRGVHHTGLRGQMRDNSKINVHALGEL